MTNLGDLSSAAQIPTAGIADGAVTAPKISVPSFAAYRSAAYNTIASGTVIDWDAEEWDSEGWFDLTANSFTPLQAGVYLLTWELSIASGQLAANTILSANLRKNGSTHRAGPVIMANGTNSTAAGGTALVVANGVDDDFDVVVSWTDVGNNNFNVGAANTYFHGHFVSV